MPTIDNAPTTIDRPPILFASSATAALEITAPIALTRANHPIIVPRRGVGNSSVAATLLATVPPLSHRLNQKKPADSHISGHAKCDGGPQNTIGVRRDAIPNATTVGTRPNRSALHAPNREAKQSDSAGDDRHRAGAAADMPTTETAW